MSIQRILEIIARYEHKLLFGMHEAEYYKDTLNEDEKELIDLYTTEKLKNFTRGGIKIDSLADIVGGKVQSDEKAISKTALMIHFDADNADNHE